MSRTSLFVTKSHIVHVLVAFGGLLAFAGIALAQTVIYEDDFNAPSAARLVGRAPAVANGTAGGDADATWLSGGHWKSNGTIPNGPVDGTASYQNKFTDNGLLPFRPEDGYIYTLSVTMTRNADSPENWLWAGFGSDSLEAGGASARPNSGQRGLGWIIAPIGGGFQSFVGPATQGAKARKKPALKSGEPFELRTILDTKTDPQNWSFEWFVNGQSVRGPEPLHGTTVGGQEIRQVGFGRFANAGGSISHFRLTVE